MLSSRRFLASVSVVLAALAVGGCEPENLARPLPLYVDRSGQGAITVTAPLCEGDRILETWVRSPSGAYRSARWREDPELELRERAAGLEYSQETLSDASFNLEETVPVPDDFRGSFSGPEDVRGIWVRTSRGTEGVILSELDDVGAGPWIIQEDEVSRRDPDQDVSELLDDWCRSTAVPGTDD